MTIWIIGKIILELVRLLLPRSITFNPNPNASEYHFFSPSEVDTQLHDITIFDGVQTGHHIGLTQAHVVQKCPRRTTNIFDVPLSIHVQELAVFPTNDLGFEPHGGVRGFGRVGERYTITLRVSTDTDNTAL